MHMLPSRLVFSLALLGTLPTFAAAAEPAWQGEPDCRFVSPGAPFATGKVSWKGECRDGYASGKGVMSGRGERGDFRIEATLERGDISGSAVMTAPGFTYTGTFKNGLPHGQGFFQYPPPLGMYEGEVAGSVPHGKGEKLTTERSYYVGEWQGGRRNGYGEATFSTGGSYKGQWKNDKFHGQGTIVYAGSGRTYEGQFEEGRVAGLAAPEIAGGRYAIRVANSGSGVLKRDAVVAYLPLSAGWNELTPAQQNKMRLNYPALEAGDEPPFPAKGERALFDAVRRVNDALGGVTGHLGVHVLIGKDGKPLTVTTFGAPDPRLVRAVSNLMVLQEYKPALCQGEPCEMVYPVNFNFTVTK